MVLNKSITHLHGKFPYISMLMLALGANYYCNGTKPPKI